MVTAAASLNQAKTRTGIPASILMGGCRALTDIVMLSLAVVVGFRVWTFFQPLAPAFQETMWLAVALCLAAYAFSGLYPGVGMTAVEHMRRIVHATNMVYLMLTASMFVARDWWHLSRGGFALAWLLTLALVPMGRWIAGGVYGACWWWGVPVMVLGAGETAKRVVGNLKANHVLGYRPVVCLDDDEALQGERFGLPVPGGLDEASYYASEYSTRYAVVAMTKMPREELVGRLEEWSRVFRKIIVVPDLFGMATLWTEPRDLGGVLGLEIRCNLLYPVNRWVKRAIDWCCALAGLAIAWPALAAAALWIKRVSPGAAFYTQEREGRDGKIIGVLKLRTMYPNAEAMLNEYLAQNHEAHEEWERCCKLKHDPRILPGIGGLLRKTSLDELPQLWNVLRGEMSLVGPRPFPKYHNERFPSEFHALRTRVTPGLTGLWQVSARSDGDLKVQEALDSYYIRNWSPMLDAYILFRTVRAVLAPEGAY
jgi:Undecaprenyl-phosphate galactose phosphotransferase WbaP